MCKHLDHVFSSFFFKYIFILFFYCTVTCILETHSHGRLPCLFIRPFNWTVVNKWYAFFIFFLFFLHFSVFCIRKKCECCWWDDLKRRWTLCCETFKDYGLDGGLLVGEEKKAANALVCLRGGRHRRTSMGRGTLVTFVNTNVKKNAEAHSVFLLLDMETCMISSHNASWHFPVVWKKWGDEKETTFFSTILYF